MSRRPPPCPYGESCYRKNPEHFKEYNHEIRKKRGRSEILSENLPKVRISNNCNNVSAAKRSKTPVEIDEKQCRLLIEKLFVVKTPKDIFKFWELCTFLSPNDPKNAFKSLGFRLVGVFDVLNGDLRDDTTVDHDVSLCHWRFYYDTPEMQTFAVQVDNDFHLAFFRDTPDDAEPLIVSNNGKNKITGVADDIFTAIFIELSQVKGAEVELQKIYQDFCKKNNITYKSTKKLLSRQKKINALTLNGIGINVPVRNEAGYRSLGITDVQLKKMLEKIIEKYDGDDQRRKSLEWKEIKEIYHLTNQANDECDFGMGLELGLDLFSAGHPFFHAPCELLLTTVYSLLKREAFGQIIQAHLKNRRKGYQLSSLGPS